MDRKMKHFHLPSLQSSSRVLSLFVPATLKAILKINPHTEIIYTVFPLSPHYSLLLKILISLCIAKCKLLPSWQETESVTVLKVTKLEINHLHFACE